MILLELRFRTLAPVNNLPHYHGPQWNGLFQTLLKRFLSPAQTMASVGIMITPIETGVLAFAPGEPIHLGLAFPAAAAACVFSFLSAFNQSAATAGHFQPGQTLTLETVRCRVSGDLNSLPVDDLRAWRYELLTEDHFRSEVAALCALQNFTLNFFTPLRLARPKGAKAPGHQYCDEEFFLGKQVHCRLTFDYLLASIFQRARGKAPHLLPTPLPAGGETLETAAGALHWLDLSYGNTSAKTIGGVVGQLSVSGSLEDAAAKLLVLGQFLGVGKNASFGLGFYDIPELREASIIHPLSRGVTLMERALEISRLREARDRLPDSSPGPDGLTLSDLKKAGDIVLERLAATLHRRDYSQGPMTTYRAPKANGGFRKVAVQNVIDRVIQRSFADFLLPITETLLTASSYAYRKGLNRKGAASALKRAFAEGFQNGIKADISAFFESVSIEQLKAILFGLFPADPLPEIIASWLDDVQAMGLHGLPQGSPVSPVLSNLYLDRFDRDMAAEGFHLIRYCDDFVVLFRDDLSIEEGHANVESSQNRLGLALKHEKTQTVSRGVPLRFLGCLVSQTEVIEAERELQGETEEWLPLFRDEWSSGKPVYLSSICRGAYSSGPCLVIKNEREQTENIPWNQISRLVIIGRSPFSGGVVYRAMREEIPVTFIDIMGATRGQLHPECYDPLDLVALQRGHALNPEFCLDFARELLSAKAHNSYVILRRNSLRSDELKDMVNKIKAASNLDQLRGYEGMAARLFFQQFATLTAPFEFKGRVYHPPDGPVNAMLSFGYSLLRARIGSVLSHKGFNPRIGFFHKGRGKHMALASDLMENLRHLVERVVLTLIHRKEITVDDFSMSQKRGRTLCQIQGEAFRKFIHRFEETMAARISYHGGDKISYNAYLDEMADNLKRSMMLKIDYTPLRID